MLWLEIEVTVFDDEAAATTEEVLQPFLVDGVIAVVQLGDAGAVEATALLPQRVVKAYVEADRDTPKLRSEIVASLAVCHLPSPQFQLIEDSDWAQKWKTHYQPLRVGRFFIRPSWYADELGEPDDLLITLDPGMAFGSGTHATTQLCLQMMPRVIGEGVRVLDVGTGSGILAIGAKRLGAERVLALDVDELAIVASAENAIINNVTFDIRQGSLEQAGACQWDVVIANMLAVIIKELIISSDLLSYARSGGYIVMSGILEQQADDMKAFVRAAGAVILDARQQGEWVALLLQIP